MKKAKVYPALGLIVAALILGACLFVVVNGKVPSTSFNTECSKIPLSELESERSQGLIIKNKQLLVVKLNQESNYSVPGGHIDFGENSTEALSREISEEVGITAKPSAFKYYKTDCVPKKDKLQRVLFYLVEDYEDSITLEDKGDKVKWVGFEFEASKKADTDVKLALYYLRQDGLVE